MTDESDPRRFAELAVTLKRATFKSRKLQPRCLP